MKTNWTSTVVLTAAFLSFAGTASAHVTVWPKQSTTGAYEKYTVRVPVEKNSNTVKVQLQFPANENVETVEPVPGWNYTFQTDANGHNTGITWTATSGGIKPHEFAEFSFIGVNPKTPTSLSWKAIQTYADGSVVEWTGDPKSDTPASVTTITNPQTSANMNMNMNMSQGSNQNNNTNQATTTSANNIIPLVASGIAILLSLIALFRKK
jgi:uncharacterized protein YcnI